MKPSRPGPSALAWVLLGLLLASAAALAQDGNAIELGKRLYRMGILASGAPSRAIVQGDVPVDGTMFTCISCHQRSGLGAMEGGDLTPAVTGPILFAPLELQRRELGNPVVRRPAYTDETFGRVMRLGIDSAGKQIDPLMPLYPLPAHDMANLIAYLRSISNAPDAGVADTAVHLAMIISPEVDPAHREAAMALVTRYVGEKNALTRHETRRSENAPWHKDWQYESFRQYAFHTWELQGPEDTWEMQLHRAYQAQPVFAVVGGLGGAGNWQAVHHFCATVQLPCVLPSGVLAPPGDRDFYSLYFHGGLPAEASALARFLARDDQLEPGCRILQIHGSRFAEQRAAETFDQAIGTIAAELDVHSLALPPGESLQSLAGNVDPSAAACALVIWLDRSRLNGLAELLAGQEADATAYLSASLVPVHATELASVDPQRLRMVYPFNPEFEGGGDPRLAIWARSRQIDMSDPVMQSNVFFGLNLGLDALVGLRGNFSRDYFLERIEHMVDRMLFNPAFDHKSLAPGQRYISKGAYIVAPANDPGTPPRLLSDWIVP